MIKMPAIGTLVHSLAGRDTGEYYLVVGYAEKNFVLLANGLNRTLKKPKKKNLRHLRIHQSGSVELADKICRQTIRDEEVVQAIREMVGKVNPGGEREGNSPDV